MQCYIHVGSEKTGSSFLQCMAALGRDQLAENGLWFVHGTPFDERCMAQGKISGGNALRIADEIERGHREVVRLHVSQAKRDAEANGCHTFLLFSELLLRPLANSDGLSQFYRVVSEAGVDVRSVAITLREPIAQCLSLYKHRAKRGTAGEIADWVDNGYRLPQELRGFREQAEQLGITPTVRGYTREPGGLEKRFFEDWLGVPTPAVDMPASVNPSLTLSELILIKQMAERRPALVEPLYDALLAIDPAEKVQGSALEAHAKAVATAAVAKHAEEWQAWNRLLPADEPLSIPAPPTEIPPRPRELGLTDRQMAALAAVVDEAANSRFVARLIWRSRIRPVLSRLKQGWRR